MVDGVTRYQYGLERMPIADQVAYLQKTMMCSQKDLLFMANGSIVNFPLTTALTGRMMSAGSKVTSRRGRPTVASLMI
jgi:hypothetical protein